MTFEIEGFTPIGILGRGGFGTVHRAADDAHGREVAVKILGRIDDDSARRRFDRERRAMGTLSGHPNIGVVYTSGFTAKEEPYIVMEMIRGGSLADRLERDGKLPADEVIELGIALAEALHHAHRGGVLHLDLKPENILMSQFGRPKIVDFGIAALIDDESATATIRATPSYADPEVLDGRPGTASSDVYGLAATLFTLLTGKPPYSEGPAGLYQVMRRVALDPVPSVERADVPQRLVDVLHRAMAKRPADRPETMADFAAELRSVAEPPDTQPRARPRPAAAADEQARARPATPPLPSTAAKVPWLATSDPEPSPDPPAPTPSSAPPSAPPFAPVHPQSQPQVRYTPPQPPHPQAPQPQPPRTQPPTPTHSPVHVTPQAQSAPAPVVQPWSAQPIGGATIRGPRTGLIIGLSTAAVLLAIVLVVLIVEQRDDPTINGVPAQTVGTDTATTGPAVTVGLVDDGVVPTVIGVSTAEATAALEAHGFAVSTAPHCFDTVAGQDPAGGVEADPGTVIELTFDPCVVPDFTGLRLDSAISIVEDEFVTGLLISWPDHCEDVVLGQSIAQGTTVEPGTTVELTLRDDCS